MASRHDNLIGTRFGALVVIGRAETPPNARGRYWVCRCECGKEIVTSTTNLSLGAKVSCGCKVGKSKGMSTHSVYIIDKDAEARAKIQRRNNMAAIREMVRQGMENGTSYGMTVAKGG